MIKLGMTSKKKNKKKLFIKKELTDYTLRILPSLDDIKTQKNHFEIPVESKREIKINSCPFCKREDEIKEKKLQKDNFFKECQDEE